MFLISFPGAYSQQKVSVYPKCSVFIRIASPPSKRYLQYYFEYTPTAISCTDLIIENQADICSVVNPLSLPNIRPVKEETYQGRNFIYKVRK